jgi:hypothetical protein
MEVRYGDADTGDGTGVLVELTGNEIARAVDLLVYSQGVIVRGPRTVTVNGDSCRSGRVRVDPYGFVIAKGKKLRGSNRVLNRASQWPPDVVDDEDVTVCQKRCCKQCAENEND